MLSVVEIANELLCKLSPRHFHTSNCEVRVMFTQNVCICNGNVKQKPPQIFIALAALQSYTVVSSELIIEINSAHKSIIQLDGLRAGNRDSSAIFESSFYRSGSSWITVS